MAGKTQRRQREQTVRGGRGTVGPFKSQYNFEHVVVVKSKHINVQLFILQTDTPVKPAAPTYPDVSETSVSAVNLQLSSI